MYYITSGRPIKTYVLAKFPIIAILVFCHQTNSLKIYERCKNESTHFLDVIFLLILVKKIRRGPKLEGCAFVNFGNSSGTEEEPSQKREKKKNNQCCLDRESNPGPVDN